MITEKLSTEKRLILEAALKLMFKGFYQDADINSVSLYTGLNGGKIRKHYASDENLRMSAMKYAAVVWVKQVKADLEKQKEKKEKLYMLIRHYIAGAECHPQSLSLYVDIWKRLRDMDTKDRQLLGDELFEIYRYYVVFFQETMKEIFENELEYDLEQLAWIMVVISDGFHVQSLIKPQQMDFDRLTHVFCNMLEV